MDSPCAYGECNNTRGDFECICNDGYDGDLCENDIDECAEEPCLHGGTCEDGVNEYVCNCSSVWSGDRYENCALERFEKCPDRPGPAK